MSRTSSLKFSIIHDVKDNLFVYLFHLKWAINIARTSLIQSKLYTTITAKTQHSQNSVGAQYSSVGQPRFMSRISSLKFSIIHDIEDNFFHYKFHVKLAINIARTIFNSIKIAPHYHCKNATFTKLSRCTK